MLAAQCPRPAKPASAIGSVIPAQRQRIAGQPIQAPLQQQRQSAAFLVVLEVVFQRIHIDRQSAFLPQVVVNVLVARYGTRRSAFTPSRLVNSVANACACSGPKPCGFSSSAIQRGSCNPARIVPQRQTVAAPVAGQRPTRQRFTRIPLALAVMQKAVRRKVTA